MSWQYRLAKKKDLDGVARYSIVEAYLTDNGDVWGYTNHVDILGHLQGDEYDDDKHVKGEVFEILMHAVNDTDLDVIDMDTFVLADPDFKEELEAIRSDN